MADLKKLQEMAKSGKISKELLEDEKFKGEFKKILKEECGIDATDEQIPEVIKEIEESLKNSDALNESELETLPVDV